MGPRLRRAALLLAVLAPSLASAVERDPFTERVFLENINAQRVRRGLAPLALDPNLSAFARKRADEIVAAQGSDRPLVGDALHERTRAFGYEARFLAELMVEAEGDDIAAIESAWSEGNTGHSMILRDDIRDLGIGVRRDKNVRIYVFLFGLSAGESFAEKTRALNDREALRREMLLLVNEERRKANRRPLRSDPRLERAAQGHADDMLARSFYGHEDPGGRGPMQRAVAAGYRAISVGENIARGEFTLPGVMEGWMNSEPHRRDLLEPSFTDVGFGFAFGKNANGYQVFWVQLFGRDRP